MEIQKLIGSTLYGVGRSAGEKGTVDAAML
jgi:hypothetical protein